MGVEKLAKSLGIQSYEAMELRNLYFSRMPKVKRFIDNVITTAKSRGFIRTWTGRKLHCPNSEVAYKMPNHLIQGGCADIARMAMPEIDKFLAYYESRLLLQVHDELLFEIHESELDIVDNLKNIMENTYHPYNGMKLTCGVEHSWVSWGKQDVVDGKPTRSNIQK
jgi:DNA polymerase-1